MIRIGSAGNLAKEYGCQGVEDLAPFGRGRRVRRAVVQQLQVTIALGEFPEAEALQAPEGALFVAQFLQQGGNLGVLGIRRRRRAKQRQEDLVDGLSVRTQGGAEDLDFVPMPPAVVAAIMKVWATEIKDASGKPLFAMSN